MFIFFPLRTNSLNSRVVIFPWHQKWYGLYFLRGCVVGFIFLVLCVYGGREVVAEFWNDRPFVTVAPTVCSRHDTGCGLLFYCLLPPVSPLSCQLEATPNEEPTVRTSTSIAHWVWKSCLPWRHSKQAVQFDGLLCALALGFIPKSSFSHAWLSWNTGNCLIWGAWWVLRAFLEEKPWGDERKRHSRRK